MNYDQAGNSIRGFTSVQTNRDLQFNTRRYNLHVARIQLVNIARNKQNTPNSPSWSSLPHNPKKIPNSAKQRRVCRISQPGTPLHRSTDLTIHATQFTETAIIDESKGRDKAEHNTQHHHHTRPRNRGTKKQSTESRTGRETSSRLGDSAAYRTTTRTPAISKPSTRSRRCFCGRRVMVWRRPLPRLYTRGRNAAERLCTRRIRQGNACRLRCAGSA